MTKKTLRRAVTASLAGAFAISLASCSAASDNTGLLEKDKVYAEAGEYSVTYGDIWNELKWNTHDVLDNQITNVVLNKYINRIDIVLTKDASSLTDKDKEDLGFNEENVYSDDAYNKIKETFKERIVDYVVQDIYNFTYSTDNYWDNFDSLEETEIDTLEAKYVDEIYSEYLIESIDGEEISTLIKKADHKNYEENTANYLKLAMGLSQIYYPLYAKELLAYAGLEQDIADALEDDTDDDDDQWGYYSVSDYVSKFKDEYTNNYDMSAVIINFADSSELQNTLRAFGLKFNGKNLYYIYDSKDTKTYTLNADGYMTYEDYIKYYDDFATSNLNNGRDEDGNQMATVVSSQAILEIFIQIYNYVYGGYREKLSSNYTGTTYTQLNKLRRLTDEILEAYAAPAPGKTVEDMLEEAKATLKADNENETYFTAKELKDNYGDTFKNYMYETLKLKSNSTCYSSSGQSTSLGTSLVYKFDEYTNYVDKEEVTDANLVHFTQWYNDEERSSSDITALLQDTETYPALATDILELLKKQDITSTAITNYLSAELDNVSVKIYNEATEIKYAAENENYSKALSGAGNDNILATISYDDVTWNLNIVADPNDENSILVPGTTTPFGVFDYLNAKSGTTTAIDLIAKQIIKTTKAYEDTNKDRAIYNRYIENMLLSFSNNYYSTNGYPASIGKYNFLMLYFHTASVDEIIDNYYRVNVASGKLLTDYSSDKLVSFIKKYVDIAEDNYFSLGGTRLYVYLDADDDGKADDVSDWQDMLVSDYDPTSVFAGKTFGEVAKQLICEIYNKISASTQSHTDAATALVSEINASAKVVYEDNPISAENTWAVYRHLGLNVKTADFSATNSTTDIDFSLKQRLFDYARGYSDNGKTYEYFLNNTYPTCYIEPIDVASANITSKDDDTIVATEDGFNLIMVTSGTTSASAKWTKTDNDEGILENIVLMYNENPVKIENIYNDDERLNNNQIKFYLLDYAINGSSTLAPTGLSTAYSRYVNPVVTRFAGNETQRIILINYIQSITNNNITFTKDGYNDVFDKLVAIAERSADGYSYLYNDTTGTSNLYDYEDEHGNVVTWWDSIKALLKEEA
ncbi:hypothetical protein EI71_01039 [Anaeroplasma bactoclasticum]|jgi:hypothetical protein|uniref:Uncharacterized protein n=1 Tax=Anaeroplasma bactoclasticum TaxID=2088 RepID=A0A397RT00_9MOLU|nr:hypothetical protein [Anaeroplasma bactoclasticum]RIA75866.1 hypothetical protein EI71_01039 [Anaeroplasma bactoclasticum]